MADKTQDASAVKVIENTIATAAASTPAMSVRSINIVPDSHNKSPGGMPLDIVEVEFYPFNQGNGDWMQWRDLSRFVCERGTADRLLKALGLTPTK